MNNKSTRKSFNRLMEDVEFQWYYFKNECRDLFNNELKKLIEMIETIYLKRNICHEEIYEEIKYTLINELAGDYAASIESYYGRNRFTLGIIQRLTSLFNSTLIWTSKEPLSEDINDFISKYSTVRVLIYESNLDTYEKMLTYLIHDNI